MRWLEWQMKKATFQIVVCMLLCFPAAAENWFCASLGSESLIDAADRWEARDGGIGFVVSDQFLLLLAACPTQFYSFMEKHPETLNSWLHEVESLSGFTGSPEERQQRKIVLSNLVEEIKEGPSQKGSSAVRRQVLNVLETMCVRAVDEEQPKPPCHRVKVKSQ